MHGCEKKYRVEAVFEENGETKRISPIVTACDRTHAAQKVAVDHRLVWRDFRIESVEKVSVN